MNFPCHIVSVSPWPILVSINLLSLGINLANWIKNSAITSVLIIISLLIIISFLWWRDVLREARQGDHTLKVQQGIKLGFMLFIISEI